MFTTYPVTKKLQPYVSFYYDLNWERKDYENDIRETVLPSGKGFMVFQYKGRFRGMMDTKEQFVPKYYTIGQQTKTYTLFSDHETTALSGVAFKPTGLYHMFGQNMALLANSPMDSKTVLGSDLTHFEISYEKESRTEMKVNMVEGLLLNQLEDKKYVPSFIDIAIDMMNRSLGCEPITKITKKLSGLYNELIAEALAHGNKCNKTNFGMVWTSKYFDRFDVQFCATQRYKGI